MTGDPAGIFVAIETSGRRASIAVGRGETPDAIEFFEPSKRNAVDVIPKLAEVFSRLGWQSGDISAISISSGPGSFTGLRVGFAAAQTLALSTGARVVVVPTAEVLAYSASADAERIGVVLNTKGSVGFVGVYERAGEGLREVLAPATRDAGQVLDTEPSGAIWLAQRLPEPVIEAAQARGIIWKLGDEAVCSAAVVYRLGRAAAARGHYSDPAGLVPEYGREPEAVSLWRQRPTRP